MGFGDFIKTVAPFVPVVGPAIGAVAGLIGSRQTNSAQDARQAQAQDFNSVEAQIGREFNAAEAEKNRTWSAQQAALQMGFQERLSGTAYQRSMGDMRAAGLNPILAYAQGGASTPSGAMGQGSAASASSASSPAPQAVRNNIGEAIQSASQLAQLGNIRAQTEATEAQAKKTDVEREIMEDEALFDEKTGEKRAALYARNDRTREEALLKMRQSVTENERTYLTVEQRKLVEQEIQNAVKEGRRIEATTRDQNANAFLRELASEEAKNAARFHKENPTFSTYSNSLKAIGDAINSAGRLKGLMR